MQDSYIERILKARVYDVAIETPLEPARRLSRRLDNPVLFKREDLQPVFSFKLRGAYNRIAALDDATARRGVICASAGNHAQGVALSARRRGTTAVMYKGKTYYVCCTGCRDEFRDNPEKYIKEFEAKQKK